MFLCYSISANPEHLGGDFCAFLRLCYNKYSFFQERFAVAPCVNLFLAVLALRRTDGLMIRAYWWKQWYLLQTSPDYTPTMQNLKSYLSTINAIVIKECVDEQFKTLFQLFIFARFYQILKVYQKIRSLRSSIFSIITHLLLVLYSGWLKYGHVGWTNIGLWSRGRVLRE